jgi:hypothetical protein
VTKEQFERAKSASDKGILVHLVCNEADGCFFSDDPDCLSIPLRTVLAVETFFSAVCDGGFEAWFDLDHGELAHCGPAALRSVGLPRYAVLAQAAIALHDCEPQPTTIADWGQHLGRIRSRHCDEDCSELYEELDAAFFGLLRENPNEFRERVFDFIVQHEAEYLRAFS